MLQKLLAESKYGKEAANSRAQGFSRDGAHAMCQQEGLKHTPRRLADDTAHCLDQLPHSPASEQEPLTGATDASFL